MGEQAEIDMELRDPEALNSHLTVRYPEIFGEPDPIHSIDCVWKCSYKCFNCTLSCCYKFLTVLCGVPLAFLWACEFACTSCYHIWCLTPSIKLEIMNLLVCRKIFEACLQAFVAPMVETCALCFSKIAVAQK